MNTPLVQLVVGITNDNDLSTTSRPLLAHRDSNVPIPACTFNLAGTAAPAAYADVASNDDPDVATTSTGSGCPAAAAAAGTLATATATSGASGNLSRSPSERLLAACRDYTAAYLELQEKYHDQIYGTLEKLVRTSQAAQLKQLKTQLEKETSDVMRQLNVARRTEVKALAVRHKDRDELVR